MARRKRKRKEETETRDPVVWAYVRVSTEEQSLKGQENTVLRHANERGWTISRFFTLKMSSKKCEKQRQIDELKAAAKERQFDILVVSELSRLGRGASLGEIPRLIDFFRKHGIALHSVKESIDTLKSDISTTIRISVFSLFAQIERMLISERTKAALAARKAAGVKLGRPAGVSKLDPDEDEIRQLVELA